MFHFSYLSGQAEKRSVLQGAVAHLVGRRPTDARAVGPQPPSPRGVLPDFQERALLGRSQSRLAGHLGDLPSCPSLMTQQALSSLGPFLH